jgi:hypothetical protein
VVSLFGLLEILGSEIISAFMEKKKKERKKEKGSYGHFRIHRMIKKSVIFSHPSLPLHTYDDIVSLQLQTFFVVIKFRSQKITGQ